MAVEVLRMKTRSLSRLILLMTPLIFGGGCATHALWKESSLDAWNEPADEPKLQLYDTPQHKDVLVEYQEYSERHDSFHTRSYWLLKNQKRIEQRREPEFVGFPHPHHLTPIPVFAETNAPATGSNAFASYAVVGTNQNSFLLYSSAQNGGPYRLPVYNDGVGQAERIALTPLCVVADITIVGGFIACAVLAESARNGTTFYSPH
jgi:hypothetical protein